MASLDAFAGEPPTSLPEPAHVKHGSNSSFFSLPFLSTPLDLAALTGSTLPLPSQTSQTRAKALSSDTTTRKSGKDEAAVLSAGSLPLSPFVETETAAPDPDEMRVYVNAPIDTVARCESRDSASVTIGASWTLAVN
jgi:hypothetical protein